MTTLVVPRHLREQVRQFAEDFRTMASVWIELGVHDQEEIDYLREVIREAMACELPPDPEVDDRPREERIVAWCETMAALREEWDRLKPPTTNSVKLAAMVISTMAEREARRMVR